MESDSESEFGHRYTGTANTLWALHGALVDVDKVMSDGTARVEVSGG